MFVFAIKSSKKKTQKTKKPTSTSILEKFQWITPHAERERTSVEVILPWFMFFSLSLNRILPQLPYIEPLITTFIKNFIIEVQLN